MIVVVYPDPAGFDFVSTSLGDAGYRVQRMEAVEGIPEALAKVGANLLLLDLDPAARPTGIELLEAVRRDAATGRLPVITIGDVADADGRHRAIAAGATEVLLKPFHPDELLLRVRNVLAAVPARRAPEGRAAQTGPPGETAEGKTERKRVLVVDDNAHLRRILGACVRAGGFEVIELDGGEQVVETARRRQVSAIFLDVMMPRMSGFEVVEGLRADPATREIPVIMCTAKSAREDVLRALKGGATDYIVKPFNAAVVVEKLRRLLDAQPEGDAGDVNPGAVDR